jgi:hypothetical protein
MAELDRILRAARSAGTAPAPPEPPPIDFDRPLSDLVEELRRNRPAVPGLPDVPTPRLPGGGGTGTLPPIPMPRVPNTGGVSLAEAGRWRAMQQWQGWNGGPTLAQAGRAQSLARLRGEDVSPVLEDDTFRFRPEEPESKGFSPLRELRSVYKESVGGVWELAKMPVAIGAGTAMLGKDLVTGDWDRLDDWDLSEDGAFEHYYGPATQMGKGLVTAGENFGKLAGLSIPIKSLTQAAAAVGWEEPERLRMQAASDSRDRYVTAYREGRLLSEAMTDIGIASGLAGGAAMGARGAAAIANRLGTGARAARFAARAQRAASILDDLSYRADWSDPVVATGRLLKQNVRRVLRRPSARLATAMGRATLNDRAQAVADQHGMMPLFEEQIAGRSIADLLDERIMTAQAEVDLPRQVTDVIGRIDERSKLTPAQRRMVTLMASGSYESVFKSIDAATKQNPVLGQALLNAWNERLRDKPESMWLTMDDVNAAMDYYNERMPPEQQRTLDVAVAAMQERVANWTQQLVDAGRLDPEQLVKPTPIRNDDGVIVGVENDMMMSRVAEIANRLQTEMQTQGKVVEELEGKEARTSQEYASQSLSVAAMGPPGTRGVDAEAVRQRAKVLAQNYQQLRQEVRSYEVKLAGISDEWHQLKRKIAQTESNGNEVPAEWARREKDLRTQIISIEAQLSDLRAARDTIGHADEAAPDLRGMDDEQAVATLAEEYADVLRDASQHEFDTMRDIGGTPSRTAVESVVKATGEEGRRYGGKYEADDYVQMGALSDTGVNIHDFAARIRSHFDEWERLSDAEIMEQYFAAADVLIDLKRNDLADINAVVQPIARYLDMQPSQIKAALRGGWTETMGEASLDVLDQVRAMYAGEFENTTGLPGFDVENALRSDPDAVRGVMDRLVDTFDQLLAERGMMGGGAAAREVVRKLTPDQMIGWIAHNRIPQELRDMLQSGELLGDYQIAAMHRAVQFMRATRREIVSGRREDILQGRERVADEIDARELEAVDAFKEDVELASYDPSEPTTAPLQDAALDGIEGTPGNEALVRERATLAAEMREQLPAAYKLADQARQRVAGAKDAAARGEQDYRLAAAATPEGYWTPGENGELAPGIEAAIEMGATGQRLKDVRSELAWERKKHERMRVRVETLEPTLKRSQQDTLRAIDKRAINKVVRLTYKLSKRPLGGVEFVAPKRPGDAPYYKITGTIRDVAEKLGITAKMYEILEARPGVMGPLKETPAQEIGVMGQTSPSLEILYEAIAATDTWDLLTGEIRDELAYAVIADDIQRSVNQPIADDVSLLRLDMVEADTLYRIEQAARKHEGISARTGRIDLDELGPKIGEDFVSEVQAVFDEARMKRAHELKVVNDQFVAVMAAPFRRVAILGRHQLADHLALASERYAEYRQLTDRMTHMQEGPDRNRVRDEAKGKRLEAEWIARAAEDIPTSMLHMVQQGVNPTHLMGGAGIPLSAVRASPGSTKLADKAIGSEMQMRHGHLEPDLDNFTRRELAVATEFMRREVIKAIAQNPEMSLSMMELLREHIEDYRARTNTQGYPADAEMVRLTRELGFELVGRRPGRQRDLTGLEGLDEWEVFGKNEFPQERLNMEDGGPRVISRVLADAIRDQMDYRPGKIGRNWDALQGIWKVAVLPLRPAWWITNIFGNALMSMAGTGTKWMPMTTMASEMRKTLELNKARMEQLINREMSWNEFRKAMIELGGQLPAMPNRLAHNGLSHMDYAGLSKSAEPDFMMGRALKLVSDPEYVQARRTGEVERPLGRKNAAVLGLVSRLAEFGYRMNEMGDNLFRNTMFNVELDRRLPPGITPEDVHLGRVQITPEIQAMMDESTRVALGALGDFSRLTPAERRYFKRFMPFYPWLRHQIRISILMPLMSPLRAAFLSMVYQIMVEDDDQQQGWMETFGTSINTPFGRIAMRGANPFQSLDTNVLFSGEGARSISPFIGLGYETLSPVDLSQGAPWSRPRDQSGPGLYGGTEPMSIAERFLKDPLGAIGEFGYTAAGLTPQTGLLRDAALSQLPSTGLRGEGSRPFNASVLDSGDVSPYPGREGGSLAKIAQGLGIPFPSSQPMYEQRVRLQDAARRARGG